MDNDDRPIGRVLSRREVLALLGSASAGLVIGCAPSPTLQPTATTAAPAQATTAAPTATTAAASPTSQSPSPQASPQATAGATSVATPVAQAAGTPILPPESATAVAQAANPTTVAQQASAAATASAASTPGCVVRPELTEGPYYVDENLDRSDIRSDPSTGAVKDGVPLVLRFQVSRVAGGCTPLQGAEVEVWHCDAAGVYSDVNDPSGNTTGQKWLRGSQMTDASGVATFTTIYPGWYRGRAVHIHFKIHPTANTDFTSQLFFDEATTTEVYAMPPYASKGAADTPNSRDSIYRNGGDQLLLKPTKSGQGYAADFPIGVDLST